MKTDPLSRKADYIGITGSVLCLIHCMITPVLLMTTTALRHEHLHIGYLSLDYVFIGVNVAAVYFATKNNRSMPVKRALWGFLILFAIGIVFENVSEGFQLLGYAASAGLVMTHLVNIRQHRLQHNFEPTKRQRSVRSEPPVAEVAGIGQGS